MMKTGASWLEGAKEGIHKEGEDSCSASSSDVKKHVNFLSAWQKLDASPNLSWGDFEAEMWML